MFVNTILIALLSIAAFASAACDPTPSQFLIYANTTGNYGALGGPCKTALCGVFFSVNRTTINTYYTLNDKGQLLIAASQQPTDPVGHIGYRESKPGHTAVYFGTPKFVKNENFQAFFCSIEDSSDGDGTCDLVCRARSKSSVPLAQSINLGNYAQLWFGQRSPYEAIQIKVDYDTSD